VYASSNLREEMMFPWLRTTPFGAPVEPCWNRSESALPSSPRALAGHNTHRCVHDAEGIVSRRLLGEVSRVGLSFRTELIEVNELSSFRLEVRAQLLESSLSFEPTKDAQPDQLGL